MLFFSFINEAPNYSNINLRVWLNQSAKEESCIRTALEDESIIFIVWSKVTFQHFQDLFRKRNINNKIMIANDVFGLKSQGSKFVLIERHYDHDKESKLIKYLNAKNIIVHTSLSDPIMSAFNSVRMQKVREKFRNIKNEYIEHRMINSSIEKAMTKISNGDWPEENSKIILEWIEGID